MLLVQRKVEVVVQVAHVALVVAAHDHLVEPYPMVLGGPAEPVLVGLEVHAGERRIVLALEALQLLPVGVRVDGHRLQFDYRVAYLAVATALVRQVEDLSQLVEAEVDDPVLRYPSTLKGVQDDRTVNVAVEVRRVAILLGWCVAELPLRLSTVFEYDVHHVLADLVLAVGAAREKVRFLDVPLDGYQLGT